MRRLPAVVVVVSLIAAACSDTSMGPANQLESAPTLQAGQVGGDPADDLCAGLSPCDAFDYDRDGDGDPETGVPLGAPGICFLPSVVGNHLSDPACSGDFVPGLDRVFQLAWCKVTYAAADGSEPPSIDYCQQPSQWQDLVDGGGFYSASVRWRRSEAAVGDVFRLYVVRGGRPFAHRDVIIDPNQTRPADDFVHATGYGTEPVKVRITEAFACVYFDTQEGTAENAATCLIDGSTSLSFETDEVTTTFSFPEGNPTFFADFEVSECLSLGFFVDALGGVSGNALVDTPLADCKISMSSEELESLAVPGQILVTLNDPRWDDLSPTAPFRNARLNVLQVDEFGVGLLPPTEDPGWFGEATSSVALLRWVDEGLDKLASLVAFFGPQPLYARIGGGWDFTRMSDFQVALMPVMDHDATGAACTSGLPSCLDLGTVGGTGPLAVGVRVSAPPRGTTGDFDVPDARLHFFPQSGTVACPSLPSSAQRCYSAGALDLSTSPPSTWDHLVVITGSGGRAVVDWTLAPGNNTLRVAGCGIARPGANEPNPPGQPGADHVWGSLGDCSNRAAAMSAADAYDNGPADGDTPFEPVDVTNEVAIYGLPLTFEARTCPTITIDGRKGDVTGTPEWDACATRTGFIAPVRGPRPSSPNAWLYTYNDGDALYLGLEVVNDELGNKIFINLVESFAGGAGVAAAGDELLVNDFGSPSTAKDWHFTQACVGNSSSSLCGDPDLRADGGSFEVQAGARLGGAGAGRVFYEFKRPLGSPNAAGPGKEDLAAVTGQQLGLLLNLSQGQGGGMGGFTYPDPQASPVKYHAFTIR